MRKIKAILFIIRFLQVVMILPWTLLWYYGKRKMGVMRYGYFLNGEITNNILTHTTFIIIGIVAFLITCYLLYKLLKNQEYKYLVGIIFGVLLIFFSVTNFMMSWLPYYLMVLGCLGIFILELLIIIFKKKS